MESKGWIYRQLFPASTDECLTVDIRRIRSGRDSVRTAARMLIGVACVALAVNPATAETVPDACKLLSRMEIQREIGGTATGFAHATTFRNGSTSMCQGSVGGATITVRISIESK